MKEPTNLHKIASYVEDASEKERMFMEMGYQMLSERAGPLMQDRYRVGFEIIKNDPEYTSIFGVYVFRAGKELILIPSFYRNNRIRGMDSMMQTSVGLFRPLSHDWAQYMLTELNTEKGDLFIRQEVRNMLHPNPREILSNDQMRLLNTSTIKAASKDYRPGELITRFLSELTPQQFDAVRDSLLKSAARYDRNMDALCRVLGHEVAPAVFSKGFRDILVKHASVKDGSEVKERDAADIEMKIYVAEDKAPEDGTDEELKEFYLKGYHIEDHRPEDGLHTVIEVPRVFEEVTEAGLYEVPLPDGSVKELFAIPVKKVSKGLMPAHDDGYGIDSCKADGDDFEFIGIDLSSRKAYGLVSPAHGGILGNPVVQENDPVEGLISDSMEAGGVYLVIDTDTNLLCQEINSAYRPFVKVFSVDKSEEVDTYHVCHLGTYWESDEYSKKKLTHYKNTPIKSGGRSGEIGNSVKFIKVADSCCETKTEDGYTRHKALIERVLTADLNSLILKTATVKAERIEENNYRITYKKAEEGNYHKTATGITKVAAVARLARAAGITIPSAEIVVENSGKEFMLVDGEKLKSASQIFSPISFRNEQSFDQDLMIPQEVAEFHVVQAEDPDISVHDTGDRYGDEWKVIDSGIDLTTSTPIEMFRYSQENNVKSIIETDALLNLAETFDVGAAFDSYIPEMEKAVDRMLRIVFLINWAPQEVSEVFGSDDTVDIESMMRKTAYDLGERILSIRKKMKTN